MSIQENLTRFTTPVAEQNLAEAKKIADSYKITFQTPAGSLVLNDLLQQYVLGARFHQDSHSNAAMTGKRDLVLSILELVYTNKERIMEYVKRAQGN